MIDLDAPIKPYIQDRVNAFKRNGISPTMVSGGTAALAGIGTYAALKLLGKGFEGTILERLGTINPLIPSALVAGGTFAGAAALMPKQYQNTYALPDMTAEELKRFHKERLNAEWSGKSVPAPENFYRKGGSMYKESSDYNTLLNSPFGPDSFSADPVQLGVSTTRQSIWTMNGLNTGQRAFLDAGLNHAARNKEYGVVDNTELGRGYQRALNTMSEHPTVLGTVAKIGLNAGVGYALGNAVGFLLGGNSQARTNLGLAGSVLQSFPVLKSIF